MGGGGGTPGAPRPNPNRVSFSPESPHSSRVLLPYAKNKGREGRASPPHAHPVLSSYLGWSYSMSSAPHIEPLFCSLFCPLLLEARTHATLVNAGAGRRLLLLNMILLFSATASLLAPLPLTLRLLSCFLIMQILCWQRRIRRRAMLEEDGYEPEQGWRAYVYERCSHGLFTVSQDPSPHLPSSPPPFADCCLRCDESNA